MALFGKSPVEKILAIYDGLSDEDKELVKGKIVPVEETESEAETETEPEIESTENAENVEEVEETENVETTDTENAEETQEPVNEEGGEPTDGDEPAEPVNEEETLTEEVEKVDIEQKVTKLEDMLMAFIAKVEGLMVNTNTEDKKESFGLGENSQEYKSTYKPTKTSEQMLKELFNK